MVLTLADEPVQRNGAGHHNFLTGLSFLNGLAHERSPPPPPCGNSQID